MSKYDKGRRIAAGTIWFPLLCVALGSSDLLCLLFFRTYRQTLGTVSGLTAGGRLVPPIIVCTLSLGCLVLLRRRPSGWSKLVVGSTAIFTVTALAAFIPWVGPFFVTMTPIASLYWAALIWLPYGNVVGTGLVLLFVAGAILYGTRILAET